MKKGEFFMTDVKRVFKVNGQPFYPVGGESCNSSGYNDRESEAAFKVTKLLHGNTLEIPVYWEQVEAEEGKFDFAGVDALLDSARRYGVKLILLWFATWKNGNMDYVPVWVKTNPDRFKRTIDARGESLWNLSAHCKASLSADSKAFAALCKHLKAKDSVEQTVIALQVENEPDVVGSNRDYSPEGDIAFISPVPDYLVAAIKKHGRGPVYDLWQKAGGKNSGTWKEFFGGSLDAEYYMYTWSIARYIDGVTEAGKAVYDIPMFINLWLKMKTADTEMRMDLFRWATPHVDLIAPDNYRSDSRGFETTCAIHSREDNPFFMPETNGDQFMFRAVADYNLIGYFFYGLEHHIIAKDDSLRPESQPLVDRVRSIAAITPLLLKYQGTGKIHAVLHDDQMPMQRLDLDGFIGLVEFGDKPSVYVSKDWRHRTGSNTGPIGPGVSNIRGGGLVIQAGKNEFYLVGNNYRLFLQPKSVVEKIQGPLPFIEGRFVSVDEGYFNQKGEFVAGRRRNGDEIGRRGLWVESDIGVLRAITCD
jgi:hypothetical protein